MRKFFNLAKMESLPNFNALNLIFLFQFYCVRQDMNLDINSYRHSTDMTIENNQKKVFDAASFPFFYFLFVLLPIQLSHVGSHSVIHSFHADDSLLIHNRVSLSAKTT